MWNGMQSQNPMLKIAYSNNYGPHLPPHTLQRPKAHLIGMAE